MILSRAHTVLVATIMPNNVVENQGMANQGMANSGMAMPAWAVSLLQMASPMLPIGAFSYSQGLEMAHAMGWVENEAQAQTWIASQWQGSFAPRELAALQLAYAAVAHHDLKQMQAIDDEFLASRDSAEARMETQQSGRSLMKWLRSLVPQLEIEPELMGFIHSIDGDKLCGPIAFAICAHAQRMPSEIARMAWGWSWLENQVQAAVKIIPLGQTAGQRLLLELRQLVMQEAPVFHSIVPSLANQTGWSFNPLGAIASMRHERLYTRIFRS